MALIVNKINQFDKDIRALQESLTNTQQANDTRMKKLEKAVQQLSVKFDELNSTFDACFADSDEASSESMTLVDPIDSSDVDFDSQIRYDADGSVLVSGDRKEEMISRGYTVIGTVSEGSKVLLKMRQ